MNNSLRGLICVFCFVLCVCAVPTTLYAEDMDIAFPVRMPYRIVRGVTNIALGWTEILVRPFGEAHTESVLESISTGGINTLVRFSAGITDVVTFWDPHMALDDTYPDWEAWPYLFHWS